MEIKNIGLKLVKPSMPTPFTLRTYNISFFDEQQLTDITPLILYYSASKEPQNDNHGDVYNHLETSLSKTLTDFYPLAGRYIRQAAFVDCSDQGVVYVQAKASLQLLEFLGLGSKLKLNMLQDFLPIEIDEEDVPMLSIKVTAFKCGGFAIGMSFSHKISDVASMCTFIDSWATRTQESGNEEIDRIQPDFSLTLRFPKRGVPDLNSILPKASSVEVKNSVQVFIFKGNEILKMRQMFTLEDNKVHRPSKVLLVEALLWKALMGVDNATTRHKKMSCVSQAVNLRTKLVSKLPNDTYGNFVTIANARLEPSGQVNNMDLRDYYKLLHDSITDVNSKYIKELSSEEIDYGYLVKPFLERDQYTTNFNDVNFYFFTSWSKFAFSKADFGWGKPVWKSTTYPQIQNIVILMDDQEGDGVEAWVFLEAKRMCQLEQDPNIKAYLM